MSCTRPGEVVLETHLGRALQEEVANDFLNDNSSQFPESWLLHCLNLFSLNSIETGRRENHSNPRAFQLDSREFTTGQEINLGKSIKEKRSDRGDSVKAKGEERANSVKVTKNISKDYSTTFYTKR